MTQKKRLTLSDGSYLLVGCIADISNFRRAEALIRHNAEHDALTGLPNRRLFTNRIRSAVEGAQRGEEASVVLLIDLDGFKPINDIHGHTAGDSLLCEIATRLTGLVRSSDLAARLGGDEFAIISQHESAAESYLDAAALANRIIGRLQEPFVVADATINVGASIGIAVCPDDGLDAESLLRSADLAMYAAKENGRSTFRFYEPSMQAEIRRRAALDLDFREALSSGSIRPYYQPLIELASGRLVGFEVLARWRHATAGFVPPESFIPIAEKLGLISELTLSLLRKACGDAKTWPADLMLSLNISPLQLKDRLLPMQLVQIMRDAGIAPTRLEIEITEGALVPDLQAARAILTSFRNLGIGVALDDFGSGYSGIYRLRELPIDKIKIDRLFIQSMRENPQSAKIVSAILGLGKSLSLPITAEGIEDADMLARVTEGGCEIGQGFYFGKAMPASEAGALIEELRGAAGSRTLIA